MNHIKIDSPHKTINENNNKHTFSRITMAYNNNNIYNHNTTINYNSSPLGSLTAVQKSVMTWIVTGHFHICEDGVVQATVMRHAFSYHSLAWIKPSLSPSPFFSLTSSSPIFFSYIFLFTFLCLLFLYLYFLCFISLIHSLFFYFSIISQPYATPTIFKIQLSHYQYQQKQQPTTYKSQHSNRLSTSDQFDNMHFHTTFRITTTSPLKHNTICNKNTQY